MKQRVPLTNNNKEILIKRYHIDPVMLTREYWIKQIMNNEVLLLEIIEQRRGSKDLQRRIKNRAGRMLRRHIREVLGLPKPSGNIKQQRKFNMLLAQSGLELQ